MVGVFSLFMVGVVLAVPDQALYFSSNALILSSIINVPRSESETSSRSFELLDLVLKSKLFVSVDKRLSRENRFFGTGERLPKGLMMLAFLGDVLLVDVIAVVVGAVLVKFGMWVRLVPLAELLFSVDNDDDIDDVVVLLVLVVVVVELVITIDVDV